jgi:hypothetical protein
LESFCGGSWSDDGRELNNEECIFMKSPRYEITTHVDHGCCYEYAIMDTQTPTISGEQKIKDFTSICEVSELEYAQIICNLLNDYENKRTTSKS